MERTEQIQFSIQATQARRALSLLPAAVVAVGRTGKTTEWKPGTVALGVVVGVSIGGRTSKLAVAAHPVKVQTVVPLQPTQSRWSLHLVEARLEPVALRELRPAPQMAELVVLTILPEQVFTTLAVAVTAVTVPTVTPAPVATVAGAPVEVTQVEMVLPVQRTPEAEAEARTHTDSGLSPTTVVVLAGLE